jgi:molecular chaperone DnaK
MAQYNKTLGRFQLDGIAPARRGVPQIEVTFDIDANGIVNVTAQDKGTGREQHITITASSNLSKDEIERAVHEAEQYAAEDAKRKEEVDTRNQAEQLTYQADQFLSENGDKIPAEDKTAIENGKTKVQDALKGTDVEAIKAATEELTKTFYDISAKLYQQANPQGAQGGYDPNAGAGAGAGYQQGGAQDGRDYQDADYEVVDDDK